MESCPDDARRWSSSVWRNWSGDVVGTPERTYRARSLDDLVAVVCTAERAEPRRHVRAYGSRWSFTDLAYTQDYVVDTSALNRPVEGIYPNPVEGPPGDAAVYHVEAGIILWDLCQRLDGRGAGSRVRSRWAPPTMPNAVGQSLAGAISTGVHGDAISQPPISDFIEAVHLVGPDGRQHWVERAGLNTDQAKLTAAYPGLTIHRDTDLLRAVSLSLGCGGLIYAVVLRVVPQYWLREERVVSDWDSVRVDLDGLLSDPDRRCLEVIVDPYPKHNGQRVCYVTSRYVTGETSARPHLDLFGQFCRVRRLSTPVSWASAALLVLAALRVTRRAPGAGALAAAAAVLALASRAVHLSLGDLLAGVCNWLTAHGYQDVPPRLGRLALRLVRPPSSRRKGGGRSDISYRILPLTVTPAECYRFLAAEYFLSVDDVDKFVGDLKSAVFDVLGEVTAEGLRPVGYLSLRFMTRSQAPLAMQRWRRTCSIEVGLLHGVRGNEQVLRQMQAAVLHVGGTVHWGQYNDLEPADVESMYPGLSHWQQLLLKVTEGSATFSNEYSARCGLQ